MAALSPAASARSGARRAGDDRRLQVGAPGHHLMREPATPGRVVDRRTGADSAFKDAECALKCRVARSSAARRGGPASGPDCAAGCGRGRSQRRAVGDEFSAVGHDGGDEAVQGPGWPQRPAQRSSAWQSARRRRPWGSAKMVGDEADQGRGCLSSRLRGRLLGSRPGSPRPRRGRPQRSASRSSATRPISPFALATSSTDPEVVIP